MVKSFLVSALDSGSLNAFDHLLLLGPCFLHSCNLLLLHLFFSEVCCFSSSSLLLLVILFPNKDIIIFINKDINIPCTLYYYALCYLVFLGFVFLTSSSGILIQVVCIKPFYIQFVK